MVGEVEDEEEKKPNPIDVHVGMRVRTRRLFLGMSQEKLGDELGITFQQIQKYERGVNRIGASRLYRISKVLQVPVGYFFEGLDVVEEASDVPRPDQFSPEALLLAKLVDTVARPIRMRILELVRTICGKDENGETSSGES